MKTVENVIIVVLAVVVLTIGASLITKTAPAAQHVKTGFTQLNSALSK